MTKLAITLVACLSLTTASFSQDRVERFCTIHMYSNGTYSKLNLIGIDFGQNTSSTFRDSSVRNGLQNITVLKTETEVLNRMAAMGWNLFSIIPNDHLLNTCIFRKYFTKDELVNSNPK